MTAGRIVLLAEHRPRLTAGRHEVTLDQPVSVGGPPEATYGLGAVLHVRGPRTALSAGTVESRFPASGHGGQDAAVLPHVVLTRSTLPWERTAQAGSGLPWLAVLMLTDAEAATARESTVGLGTLRSPSSDPVFPGLDSEEGDKSDDPVRVLDVPAATLRTALPELSWLGLLAHVREQAVDTLPGAPLVGDLDEGRLPGVLDQALRARGRTAGGVRVEVPGQEWRLDGPDEVRAELRGGMLALTAAPRAVVLGCRLTRAPESGPPTRYRAYLVSLEHRWDAAGTFAGLDGAAPVRLVLFDAWDLEVSAAAGALGDRLAAMSVGFVPAVVTGPPDEGGPDLHLGQAGYALLRHSTRTGARLRSWYRGPLGARGEWRLDDVLPADPRRADDLLLVDHSTDLLVTSYAAAWELGRMLTVADPAVSLDLVRWRSERRRYAHRTAQVGDDVRSLHLPRTLAAPPLPPSAHAALRRLLLLEGIPFGHLVPDPAMLPPDSLRTFALDPVWMRCLLQGALAVGRRPASSSRSEEDDLVASAVADAGPDLGDAGGLSLAGCLLRSSILSDWPALRVQAWDRRDTPCPVVRRAALSPDVLLVLFHGDVARVRVAPDAEALHHGLRLRGDRWTRIGEGAATGELRAGDRIPVDELGSGLTADSFAQLMIAGVPALTVDIP